MNKTLNLISHVKDKVNDMSFNSHIFRGNKLVKNIDIQYYETHIYRD